jgi:hypothetical protein
MLAFCGFRPRFGRCAALRSEASRKTGALTVAWFNPLLSEYILGSLFVSLLAQGAAFIAFGKGQK